MSISSVSGAGSAQIAAQVTLTAAQRQALANLQQVQDQLTAVTQRLATGRQGLGQIVNIVT